MKRLIDANELKKQIAGMAIVNNYPPEKANALCELIDAQPTAYDPDKVVEQLEDYGNEETHYYKNTPYEKCIAECIGKAIEIVKAGGTDAKTDS